jgi:replication-associated recombination protein RarA
MDQILGQFFVAIERFGLFTVVLGLAALGGFLALYNMSAARKTRSQSQDRIEERRLDLAAEMRQDLRDAHDQLNVTVQRYDTERSTTLKLLIDYGQEQKVWRDDQDKRMGDFMRAIHKSLTDIQSDIKTLLDRFTSNSS